MSLQRRGLVARMFGVLVRCVVAVQAWPQRLTPPAFRLVQIGSAFWQSCALAVAARLDLATVLGDRTLDAAELAAEVGAHPDALHRLLRLLAALGVFDEVAPGRYRNNALSNALRADRPGNVRAMVLMHNAPPMHLPWFETLEQGVRSGVPPFCLAHGQDLYAYMDAHPEFDALFAQAMDSVEALTGDSFATEFDWTAFERVIDLGGSKGAKSLAILKRHHHLRALIVDRAQTIRSAPEHWRAQAMDRKTLQCLDRMEFRAGDLLASVPAATSARDAYLLCAVLHCFDDDICVRVLRNIAAVAAPVGATIVVFDMIVPERNADLAAASFDMQMFMGTTGRERTRGEWERVYALGGARLIEVVDLASLGKMMVLKPA